MDNNIVLISVPLDQLSSLIEKAVEKVMEVKSHKDMADKLISPAEACKLFDPKISKVTLHKWTTDGLIPSQKIGGRVFYKYSDVIEAGSKLQRYKATRHHLKG